MQKQSVHQYQDWHNLCIFANQESMLHTKLLYKLSLGLFAITSCSRFGLQRSLTCLALTSSSADLHNSANTKTSSLSPRLNSVIIQASSMSTQVDSGVNAASSVGVAAADIQRLHVSKRYSEAAVFNGVIYLAGMVPECAETGIRSQTADVLRQVEERLAETNSDKSRILRAQIFLQDIQDIGGMNEVWDNWVVPGTAPPRATVQAALADPTWRIEIIVTAAAKSSSA